MTYYILLPFLFFFVIYVKYIYQIFFYEFGNLSLGTVDAHRFPPDDKHQRTCGAKRRVFGFDRALVLIAFI